MKTFIIGSSHITRLKTYVDTENKWRLTGHVINIRGINGGMVGSIFHHLVDIKLFSPDVIFLQIGSNDIGDSKTQVSDVLFKLECLIQVLIELKVKFIYVGLVMHRETVLRRRGLSIEEYNARVDQMNVGLNEMAKNYKPRMIFWIHRGLQFPNVRILHSDGIHLNKEGNTRLFTSIRGALLFAENKMRGKHLVRLRVTFIFQL